MKRLPFTVVLLAICSSLASGQAASPTARPTPPDTDVVKISTNLIQIDVTVTDSKGKIITDLRQNEIEIYENGQKQKISGFTFVSAGQALVEKPKSEDKTAIPVPPSILRPENVRRTFALVVDDLSLSFESAYYTRRALKKFVDEQMLEGDLVAIIRTGSGIGALQQFSSDKRMLYAAIEKVKWNPLGNGLVGAFAPLDAKPPQAMETPEPEPGERTPEGLEREFNELRSSYFATGSLGAIDYVVRGMAELPGRKSIILFSEGFGTISTNAEGFIEGTTVIEPLKKLIDAANRASVVIYAMDPRGLVYTGLTAADNTNGRSREELNGIVSDRNARLFDTQGSLQYLARETGGFAVTNNNDINAGVRRAVQDQSYYLIAYEPDDDTFDPAKRRFNNLEVKVSRPGAKVRTRSGFLNVADRPRNNELVTGRTPKEQIGYALMSPFAVNGIDLRLNALFAADAANAAYVRSLIHVDAQDMIFSDAGNGSKKAVFDVVAMSFGDNGQVVEQLSRNYTLVIKAEAFQKVEREGFVYHFVFPVKKGGAYQYRVAIRDSIGGKIGSASQFIQVPDLKKKRLSVSSIVVESLTPEEWKLSVTNPTVGRSDPMADTALRRVSAGSVLRYGYEIYNAKIDAKKQPQLKTQIRVFRDGTKILEGQLKHLDLADQKDLSHIANSGAIALGSKMLPGDYVLQIIVIDELADKKRQITSQFVQFEVVP